MNVDSRFTHLPRQRGNTLVGIIIGLVIGLGIAVIVALAITKGATPFTDKGKAGKWVEPNAGQVADPNKPMYGNKDAAKEAAKQFEKEKEPQDPAKDAKDPAKAPATDALQEAIAAMKPDAAREPKPDAHAPVSDRSKPAPVAPATPAKADAGDEKWVYYLQVGAFRETADAESARAKLALLGFEATVSDRSTDTGVLHRVRMGPYNQVERMNQWRTKLSENGIDVAVVRNQK
ncbi:MAG TPA: cell division protein [Janthinobacterium sp.]|nr:cell division protein [Janthinobacterium sp.]